MSILDQELKERKPTHPHLKRWLFILAAILVVLLIFFSFTGPQNDAAFVGHFVNPPPHFTYHGHSSYVSAVAWSPDGQSIASGGGDNTVQIWNATTGALIHKYRLAGAVFSVAWSPDGREVAAGGITGSVTVFDLATAQTLLTYKGHTDAVFSVAWSPDGKRIASASNDGTMQVWNATTGQQLLRYGTHPAKGLPTPLNSVAWSPNGNALALGGNGNALVLNANTGNEIGDYGYNGGSIHALAWSPDGTNIVFGDSDYSVQVWNVASHKNLYTYNGHTIDVFSVAWSPNGQRIASGSSDGLIEVWDALTGQHVYTYRGHADMYLNHYTSGNDAAVNSLTWSPNSKKIASASSDGTVQVWNAL